MYKLHFLSFSRLHARSSCDAVLCNVPIVLTIHQHAIDDPIGECSVLLGVMGNYSS